MHYIYPAYLDDRAETIIVSFRDLPEAVTEGRTRSEALVEATDCLDVALLFRLKESSTIPLPSRPEPGEVLVPASPSVAAKVAFVRAFSESGMTRVALARRLGLRETEIRRMLDPDHRTKLDRLGEGLRALGRSLVVSDQAADAA
ncbi:MAG: type II toxin-antitoxin system HicB family antitoxin [Hyphomicrobiales bacterium]